VGKLINASSKASSVLPGTSLYSTITGPALEGAKASQKGGVSQNGGSQDKSLNLLPYTLVATILLVIATGFYKNYSKTDVKKDDSPPIPSAVSGTPAQSTATKAT